MKRKTIIPKRMPRQILPDAAEREYFRNLRKYAEKYAKLMQFVLKEAIPELKDIAAVELPDVRLDDSNFYKFDALTSKFHNSNNTIGLLSLRTDTNIEKRVADLFDWVNREMYSSFSDEILRSWAKSMAANTSTVSKKNTVVITEKVGLDVEPLLHDRDLNPFFQNIIDENVGLIRSIPTEKETSFKNALVYAITNDMPRTQIEDIIRKHIGRDGNVKYRARFIARDQTGKLNGKLNEYRQRQLGGKRYYWRNSNDVWCRPRHKELGQMSKDGHLFSWNKPPIVDKKSGRRAHPGGDFQCRCTAEMYLDDVLE